MKPHEQKKKPRTPQPESEIRVLCKHDRMIPVAELLDKQHPKNPNHHSDEQLALYEKIIRRHGWRRAIVVSKRSGFITRGHGAVLTASRMKLATCPVDIQDYASEQEEVDDMIADNRLPQLSEMNLQQLADMAKEFGEAFDPSVWGYTELAMRNLLEKFTPTAPATFQNVGTDVQPKHTCPKCGYRFG